MNIGVIVGKFQCPYLTDGHRDVIKQAAEQNNELAIFILNGTVPFSDNSPLPYELRERMLAQYICQKYKNLRTKFFSLNDQKYASTLQNAIDKELINSYSNLARFRLYSGTEGYAKIYNGIAEIEIIERNFHSGTGRDARMEAYDMQSINVEFLQGMIHALNYRKDVCHDFIISVLIHEDGLVIQDNSRFKKHVFPSNLVNKIYDSYVEQSDTEMKQLLGNSVISTGVHLKSIKVNDWRFRTSSDFCYYHLVMHKVLKLDTDITWKKIPIPLNVEDFEEEYKLVVQHLL